MTEHRKLPDNSKQTKNEMLEKRMLAFAVGVIKELKDTRSLPVSVVDQLTRSAASIGANYAEACNASSKFDFRNKIFISKKEAAEARYWIDLCIELSKEGSWLGLRGEAQELIFILQAIINTMKDKSDK